MKLYASMETGRGRSAMTRQEMIKDAADRLRRAKKNLAAGTCSNDDGRPVCPPSKVLCRECMDMIGTKLRALLTKMENRPVPDEDRLI